MISIAEAQQIHQILIDLFGGSHGIRDIKALDAALKRPMATFSGEELYPTIVDKAAATLESITKNHPFIDGNKRTAYVLMRLFLLREHLDIDASEEEKYQMVMEVSQGRHSIEDIRNWIALRLIKMEDS